MADTVTSAEKTRETDTRAPRVGAGHLAVNFSLYEKDLSLKKSLISEDGQDAVSISKESILTKYFGPRSMKGAVGAGVSPISNGIVDFPIVFVFESATGFQFDCRNSRCRYPFLPVRHS